MPKQHFLSPKIETKFQREVPLFLENFLLTQYRIGWKKAPAPKTSSIPSSISIELRLWQTDRHTQGDIVARVQLPLIEDRGQKETNSSLAALFVSCLFLNIYYGYPLSSFISLQCTFLLYQLFLLYIQSISQSIKTLIQVDKPQWDKGYNIPKVYLHTYLLGTKSQRKKHLVVFNQLQDSFLIFRDWSKLEFCFGLRQPITNDFHCVVKFLRLFYAHTPGCFYQTSTSLSYAAY